jgi:hypothetical protein
METAAAISEDGSEQWKRWMMKTADDNESGKRFMRIVDEELLMQRRDTVSCYLFLWLFTGFLYYGMSTLRDCS